LRLPEQIALAVKGHVDGMEGTYVVGWAFDGGASAGKCHITVVGDDSGQLVAEGTACIERPDLARIASGQTGIAFRIPLPDLHGSESLRLYADGVELPNSPVQIGAGIFDGHVWVTGDQVHGWVTERAIRRNPPMIILHDAEGTECCRIQAEPPGADEDPSFAPCRFSGALDLHCFGRGELQLTAFANGERFAQTSCRLSLTGAVEHLSAERCAGWLLCPEAPARNLALDIVRNGEHIQTARCRIARPDVRGAYPDCDTPGFDQALPARQAGSPETSILSLRLVQSNTDLFEGPYVLGSRLAVVDAARALSRMSNGAVPAPIDSLQRAVLQTALSDFLTKARAEAERIFSRAPATQAADKSRRLAIIIPIFADLERTRLCLDSVLRHRDRYDHHLILVNDASPEPGMEALLSSALSHPRVTVLRNAANLGFVKSVNRALALRHDGDVLLLNSDTRVFRGGLEEMQRVAHASPDIGTVTAISNNATIFSYPHTDLHPEGLDDIDWETLAGIALAENAGRVIDLPTGHGFCLLIRGPVLARVGIFDEAFGRGYGEENDFCARAADLGYRNVAAPGAFVEHSESKSFAGEKPALLTSNLRLLHARYAEYQASIFEYERRDDLRRGRWPLDAARLERASDAGTNFVLLVQNDLGGGTARAVAEIERAVGFGGASKLALTCLRDGRIELVAAAPAIRAVFAPDEGAELIALLSRTRIELVLVHQVLGFTAGFIKLLAAWLASRNAIFYVHDYYTLCPRVTMINAVGEFCEVADADVCSRCVALAGRHEASRITDITPLQHRELFREFLGAFRHVVAPSRAASVYVEAVFPKIDVLSIAHPWIVAAIPVPVRHGPDQEIVLFGAIGKHKGSAKLMDIAQLARLTWPSLRFLVIGYTDRDDDLLRLGNVSITGTYGPADQAAMVARARGRLALFLSEWPETYSYTLTEALAFGFLPLVPDIGALAERVREAGGGYIFPVPISPHEVLQLIADIEAGLAEPCEAVPAPSLDPVDVTHQLYFAPSARE
jgi:GT2 family glycosyltransferase/glycosyltransferase involved in cell wall biosynthesis